MPDETAVRSALEDARLQGFVGNSSIDEHVAHSLAFADLVLEGAGAELREPQPTLLDLGSGGGVPGLVLGLVLPRWRVVLVEGSTRRAEWLSSTVAGLGLGNRVTVVAERAEDYGRQPHHRSACEVVTARSFGPPAVVAECAAPLLVPGGRLLVSEPPPSLASRDARDGERWPMAGLQELGLGPVRPRVARGMHFVEIRQLAPCPERYPRRVGVPRKRPIF